MGTAPTRRIDRHRRGIDGDDRRKAQLRGRDRQHAGAAADVEHTRPPLRLQQLQAEARGRMRARSERAAGVYDDRDGVRGSLLPRRADPEGPHPHGTVEPPPPVLPARYPEFWPRVPAGPRDVNAAV